MFSLTGDTAVDIAEAKRRLAIEEAAVEFETAHGKLMLAQAAKTNVARYERVIAELQGQGVLEL